MSTPVKLVGFLLALLVVFVAARGVGAVTSPVAEPTEPMAHDEAEVTRTATVGDYDVSLTGDLVPGESSPVTLTVTRAGEPVTDLQPHLGAYGHLIALREGDLGYVRVHPEDSGAGPEIPFRVEVLSEGRYRLYLDFRHDGVVRTAPFTLEAETHGH